MYRRRRGTLIVAALAGSLTVLAGCSSSAKNTAGGKSTSADAAAHGSGCDVAARGVTSTQITVGGLASKAFFGSDLGQAAEARFNQANTSGELPCGRKIHLVTVADDSGTTDGNLSAARQLVQQNNVFAIVPTLSPVMESSTGTYLDQQQVPVVGWGITAPYCTTDAATDYFFGINGCEGAPADWEYGENTVGNAFAKMLQTDGKGGTTGKTTAVIGQDFQGSQTGIQQTVAEFNTVGFRTVYAQASIPMTVSDFTPFVQALMTSNDGRPPDLVGILGQPGIVLGLARGLQQAGYQGIIQHTFYAPQLTAAAANTTAVSLWATPDSTAPAMQQIVNTLHAAGITQVAFEEAAYLSADMFVQIVKKVGPDLTPQRFQQVASHFTYDVPDVIGPTPYPQAFITGPSCAELTRSTGTKWVITLPYTCFPTVLKKQGSGWNPVPYPGAVRIGR